MKHKEKIGIMTLFFNINYGATLQAYALQRVLNEHGWQCEDIKYYREIDNISIADRGIVSHAKKTLDRIKNIDKQFKQLINIRKVIEVKRNLKQRNASFSTFINEYMEVSSKSYAGHKDIIKAGELYDIFICGSDNIWNKNLLDTAFFLDFVPDYKKKIAYAPGMSTDNISKAQENIIKPLIQRFDSLSVREKNGQKLISKISGREVSHVLDPTLLVSSEKWEELRCNVTLPVEHYIFCFFVGTNTDARKCAEKLAKDKRLPIVTLPHMAGTYVKEDDGFGTIQLYDVGPDKFLWLIKNLDFVCTDSFHGTTFSILFKKEFICFRRFFDLNTISLNYRIDSLLELLNIKGRIFETIGEFEDRKIKKIDYEKVLLRLENERKKSLTYLLNALEED